MEREGTLSVAGSTSRMLSLAAGGAINIPLDARAIDAHFEVPVSPDGMKKIAFDIVFISVSP